MNRSIRPTDPQASVFFFALAVLTWTMGCAQTPPASLHDFTITEEDGVEVALTTGGPKFDGELFAYERVLEIRPDPENEESYLWGPQWMKMTEDGRIFVSDMSADQIVVFDAEGRYLRRIGAKGEGPGEFRTLALIDIFDGTLWGMNMSPPRSQVFDLEGNFLRTVTVPAKARAFVNDSLWWGLSGGRLGVVTLANLEQGDVISARVEVYVIDAEGNALVSLDTPWIPQAEWIDPGDGGRRMVVDLWFSGRPFAAFSRDRGFYVTTSVDPEVRVYDFEGHLQRIIRIDLPPQSVTEEDRAWVLSQLEEDLRRALNPDSGSGYKPDPRVARITRDNPRYLDPKAYWQDIRVDDWGFIWLYARYPDDLPDGVSRWFVLSPEGEYLGQTISPGWAHVQRGHSLAVEDDSETAERMPVVYRIRPAVEGFQYSQ